jgi:hypothetical protein
MRFSRAFAVVASLSVACTTFAAPAAPPASPAPAAVPATQPLSRTVGVDLFKLTRNPDKTVSIEIHWKAKDGSTASRTVTLNDATVIGINGKLTPLADLTDKYVGTKCVATVGDDNVTAVNFRIGRAMVQATEDQLTPAQVAALKAVAPKATAASNASLEKRAADIVAGLKLNDAAKEARLRELLITDLRDVRDSHNAGFAPAKTVHANLVAGLEKDLTPGQIDTVKDRLTDNRLPRTFQAYHDIVPGLTAEDDAFILGKLKEARERSLDVKNADEITPIFKPYKTQCEQYITAHGHDWKTFYKAFVDKQNAQKTPAATPAQ